jgi:serine/threonine-protein kinase
MMSNNSDLTGKVLGTSKIERLIGRGGMGAVYLAQQSRPIRRVAVKVLLPDMVMSREVYNEFLVRFQREANLIAQLEHINIVPIYEYGEQDGLAYLVMPYLTGGSLRDVLKQRGGLSLQETATYLDQAASALDYAHARGVIHRDLKPANFLLHADGRLVLADFGIARIMQDSSGITGSTLTGTGMFVGTPEYMAPEMARAEHIDHRADIYELGIVLFQMLTGRVPFQGSSPLIVATKHLQEPLPLLHELNPAIPATVDTVVQQATAKKREDRFMSAASMTKAFQNAINTSSSSGHDELFIPTVLSSPRPVVTPLITPQYETPPTVQAGINTVQDRRRVDPSSGGFSPTLSAYPMTPVEVHRSASSRIQPLLIFIGLLLVLVLILGGVFLGLQLNKGGSGLSTGTVTATGANSNATSTVATRPSPALTATGAPINIVPKGAPLYSTPVPGKSCDGKGGTWITYNSPVIFCQATNTMITNPYTPSADIATQLVGTFLAGMPGIPYPSSYVVEAQFQEASSSNADFGLYFRNQPGNAEGVYTFLIQSDGSWSSYVYDNVTGSPTKIGGGAASNPYSSLKVDVVVKGPNFTFYVNDKPVGNAFSGQYKSGTAGIAVQAGGSILVSKFALFATQ